MGGVGGGGGECRRQTRETIASLVISTNHANASIIFKIITGNKLKWQLYSFRMFIVIINEGDILRLTYITK